MNKILFSLLSVCVMLFTACDDDTSNVGIDIMPDSDAISSSSQTYTLESKTVQVDSVLANTSTCYIGSVVDPEMRVKTTCDFIAQFHVPTNFTLPKTDQLVLSDDGQIAVDSCDIRIYFDDFYGDSLAAMKLTVQELDKSNVLEDAEAYYTNIDANKYLSTSPEVQKSISYAVKDLTRPESETSGDQYYRQVIVRLPKEYGNNLLRQYYEHPEYFTNSYQFIHNVCPGFYFKSSGGVGSMITTTMVGLNVYFRYHTTTDAGNDTIQDGMQRFGATEEVIQCTHVDNQYPGSLTIEELEKKNCTYVKTPTGLFTEITLPVSEITAGDHYNDSINQAKITVRKFNSQVTTDYAFPAPEYLLLIRKNKMNEFFENSELPNSTDSFLSNAYTSSSSAYQFSNIAQLITDLKIERDEGAGVEKQDDEATRNAKYALWEEANPEWNKVMLVPVDAYYTTSTSYYGTTSKTLRSLHHNLGLSSARLEGNTENPLQIQVVYSRLNR